MLSLAIRLARPEILDLPAFDLAETETDYGPESIKLDANENPNPPLVSDEPATLETSSSSMLFPTTWAAIPEANSPWNLRVFGLDGCSVIWTSVTVPAANVSSTPTVSVPLGET